MSVRYMDGPVSEETARKIKDEMTATSAPTYSTEHWTESTKSTEDVPSFWINASRLKDYDIKGFKRIVGKNGDKEFMCYFTSHETGKSLPFYLNTVEMNHVKDKVAHWNMIGVLDDGRVCKLTIFNYN